MLLFSQFALPNIQALILSELADMMFLVSILRSWDGRTIPEPRSRLT